MRDEYDKRLLVNFDVLRWLEERTDLGPYKNTSSGWANMQCPNPLCTDRTDHFGICYEGSVHFNCFKCGDDPDGMRGDGFQLVQRVEGKSLPVARNIVERYQFDGSVVRPAEDSNKDYGPCRLPAEALPIEAGREPPIVKRWFKHRGYPLEWCRHYNLHFSEFGQFPLRLFIPMYLDGVMVSWQARLMTLPNKKGVPKDEGVPKYLTCNPKTHGGKRIGEVFYGIDDVKDKPFVIIVEGPTDKWVMGDCAIAVMGKAITAARRVLLHSVVGADRPIYLLFDADVQEEHVKRRKRTLQELFNSVTIVRYDPEVVGDDPGDFSRRTVREILETMEALARRDKGQPEVDSAIPPSRRLPLHQNHTSEVTKE